MTRTGTSEARFPILFGNLSGARYLLELAIVAATYFGIAETALLLPATQCNRNAIVAADWSSA